MRVVPPPKGGSKIEKVVEPGGLLRYIQFYLINLKENESLEFSSEGRECVFVLLKGLLDVKHSGNLERFGPRRDVFSSKAHAIYLPIEDSISMKAVHPSEIALACSEASKRYEFRMIRPEDVRVRVVGEMNWRRHVHDVVTENVRAERLLVGETFNPPGNWSSYPPHRHDENRPPLESEMEEIYHYRVHPETGFGAQFIYTDDLEIDEVIKIENGITVIIDRGYHPVVAAPGYQIYYLWVLAGDGRTLIPYDDPKHSWIRAMEASVRKW